MSSRRSHLGYLPLLRRSLLRGATAATAGCSLDALQERMPFPVRAIQVDEGSEYQAEFEGECERRGILLSVLPPRTPKLNGHAERAHRTRTEGFCEVADLSWTVASRGHRCWPERGCTTR